MYRQPYRAGNGAPSGQQRELHGMRSRVSAPWQRVTWPGGVRGAQGNWNGTVVAVKVLKETGAMAMGDFRTELNVLQKVHHPHTVSEE